MVLLMGSRGFDYFILVYGLVCLLYSRKGADNVGI